MAEYFFLILFIAVIGIGLSWQWSMARRAWRQVGGAVPDTHAIDGVADQPKLARRFGVTATPSFIVVANDRIDEVRLGGLTEAWLRNRLKIEEAS